jgi:hypothetical protein
LAIFGTIGRSHGKWLKSTNEEGSSPEQYYGDIRLKKGSMAQIRDEYSPFAEVVPKAKMKE